MKRMGFSNVVTRIYADTRHESLNELNRNLITEDFAAWAEQVVSKPSRP
jgi:alpha-beta hydrolase superfamily lysophospholipase